MCIINNPTFLNLSKSNDVGYMEIQVLTSKIKYINKKGLEILNKVSFDDILNLEFQMFFENDLKNLDDLKNIPDNIITTIDNKESVLILFLNKGNNEKYLSLLLINLKEICLNGNKIITDLIENISNNNKILEQLRIKSNELEESNKILMAINDISYDLFHKEPDWNTIKYLLEVFSKKLDITRSYIMQRIYQSSQYKTFGCCFVEKFNWNKNIKFGVELKEQEFPNFICEKCGENKQKGLNVSLYSSHFEDGIPVYGDVDNMLPSSIKRYFEENNIKTYYWFPIMSNINKKVWGITCFESGFKRNISKVEIKSIQSLVNLIGFTIIRIENNEKYSDDVKKFREELKLISKVQQDNIRDLRENNRKLSENLKD